MNTNLFRTSVIKVSVWILASLPLVCGGCDDGKIYPDNSTMDTTGFTLTMKGEIEGCSQYDGSGYTVALAAFQEGNEFAVVSKNLSDGADDVSVTNIDRNVSTVEVCIINRLRKRVVTLVSENVSGATGDDVIFNVGEVDVAPFNAINSDIFTTTCLQCHGGTGTAAAGLDLNAARAYADIVNVPSRVVEGEMIVNPGNAPASTLWQIVATDVSESWRFDHSNLLTSEKSSFIEFWINNGAHD